MVSQWATTPEGTDYNLSQNFVVKSVRVDNLTASWMYSVDANYYIPPYYYGVVFNITGTDVPTLQWKTPPTIMPNPRGKGTARVEFFDTEQVPSSGLLVYNQSQIAQVLASFTTKNGGQLEPPVTLPAGTLQLVIVLPIGNSPLEIEGRGQQTTAIYPGVPWPNTDLTTNTNTVASIPAFYGGPDSQIAVWHDDAVTGQTGYIVALFVPLEPTVEAIMANQSGEVSSANPLPVILVPFGGTTSAVTIQDGSSATLAQVTVANALKVDPSAVTQPVSQTGAPWTVTATPNDLELTAYPFTITDAASPVTIVAAAPPGIFHLYAYDITLDINGAGVPCNGQFSLVGATSGKEILRTWYEAQTATGPNTVPHTNQLERRASLPQAEALQGKWTSVANHVQAIGTLYGLVS